MSLLRHFKTKTLLKINCCMAAISAFRVTQHRQIFSLSFRNRIQCIALYQLHSSQALLNLRRDYSKRQQENLCLSSRGFKESNLKFSKGPLGEKLNFFIPLGFSLVSEFLSYSKSTSQDPFDGI